jgi:hypothetical protein
MTLNQFITKYQGKFVEYHSFDPNAKYQCVDLANQYIVDVLGLTPIIGTNAQDFPKKAGSQWNYIENTPSGVPEKGDLVIFKSADGVGHISIFLQGSTSLFTSFDQNYPTGSPCKTVQHNYRNVIGWMRPKKESMSTITIEQKVFEELVGKASKFDEFNRMGYTSAAQVEQLIKDHKTELENKNNEITGYKSAAEEARKSLNELIVACSKALNTVQEMEQIKAALTKVDADLDALDSIQRQYAELQLHSKEQEENLRSEIAVLKALMAHSDQLAGASLKQIIREIVRRLRNYLGV